MATRPLPDAPAADLPVTTPAADTAFNDAFAAAAANTDELPPVAVVDAPPVEAPPPEAPPAPAEAPPAAAPPAAPAEVPADVPPAPVEAPAEPSPIASPAEDVVKGLADLLAKQKAPEAPAVPLPEVPEAVALYTPADLEVLTEYEKNWPDVAKAESLKRKAEYQDMMKFVFGEVEAYTKPLFDQIRAMGNTIHMGELRAAVPDYTETLETDVLSWIETQPTYLQTSMKQVMQTGTSDEVADLIGRYKGAAAPLSAPAAPAAPAPAAVVPTPSKTELSSAARKAAESLAPVSSDRSQVPAGEDPQDYKSAFARYAAESVT